MRWLSFYGSLFYGLHNAGLSGGTVIKRAGVVPRASLRLFVGCAEWSRRPYVTMSVDNGSVHSDIHTVLKVALGTMNSSSTLSVEKTMRHLCAFYLELQDHEKEHFLTTLASDFSIDRDAVAQHAACFVDNMKSESVVALKCEEKLRTSLLPKYSWLFSQIGRLDNGVKFLVDLRTDILNALESDDCDVLQTSLLRALSAALKDLLTLWFSVGFLTLERVTWQSSCDMLQKVSDYEAVHPIRNWTDLKRRVGPYRRCFVFTHSSMPREPIVVLHTALTTEISNRIHAIVAHPRMHSEADVFAASAGDGIGSGSSGGEDPRNITTAIFYSITISQKGLQGIELGNYLIKRVVRELQSEFPKINQFSSLSPIPGFHAWLVAEMSKLDKEVNGAAPTASPIGPAHLFTREEIKKVVAILSCSSSEGLVELKKLFVTNRWIQNEELTRELETPLMRLCCRYLYLEKRRDHALDSVANFHLKNGAVMWRLNWKADMSPRGLGNSFGIMVNYRYFLDACEENSASYLENQTICASEQIQQLARQAAAAAQANGTATSPSECSASTTTKHML